MPSPPCTKPQETRRIAKNLEIHYPPKHGSKLDMAEIEFNVMTQQCLSRRIVDINELWQDLAAWEADLCFVSIV